MLWDGSAKEYPLIAAHVEGGQAGEYTHALHHEPSGELRAATPHGEPLRVIRIIQGTWRSALDTHQ